MPKAIIGHIRNARATRSSRVAAAHPDVITKEPSTFVELDEALAELNAAGVNRLILNGGDGTIREVLTRAGTIWGSNQPDYVILPNGNTNLIARKAGGVQGKDAITRIAEANSDAFKRRTLRMLTATRTDMPNLTGFIMGAGAYETATRIAQEQIEARHNLQILITIRRLLTSSELRQGAEIGLSIDGGEENSRSRMAVMLTSFTGPLLMGLNPFWGGDGPIRLLDVDTKPPRLLLSAPFLAFGAPRRWMSNAYRSGPAQQVTLRLTTPFVMDGERFDPGSDGLVHINATKTATFLSL
ncbi:MAG: diacylglycerol kinase family protein [Pikeienuella sp.]